MRDQVLRARPEGGQMEGKVEFRVIGSDDVVCMEEFYELEEAWEVARMLDRTSGPAVHRVQHAEVRWVDVETA